MGRKCEAIFCYNNDGKNIGKSFYRFPQSVESCRKWVEYCQSMELVDAFNSAGPEALSKKRLCSDHFSFDVLKDMNWTDKGLKIGAVPSVEFMWIEQEAEQLAANSPSISINANTTDDTICYDQSRITESDEHLNKTDNIPLEDMCLMDEVFYDVEYLNDDETIENNDSGYDDRNGSSDNVEIEIEIPIDAGPSVLAETGLILPIDQSSKKLLDAHHRSSLKKE